MPSHDGGRKRGKGGIVCAGGQQAAILQAVANASTGKQGEEPRGGNDEITALPGLVTPPPEPPANHCIGVGQDAYPDTNQRGILSGCAGLTVLPL